jgi:serine/threonine protein kinase
MVKGSSKFEITECNSLFDKEKSITPHKLDAGHYTFDCTSLSNGKFQLILKVSNSIDGTLVYAEGDLQGRGKLKNFNKEFTVEANQAPVHFELKFVNRARFWQKASYDFKLIKKGQDSEQQAIHRLGSTVSKKRNAKRIRIKLYHDETVTTFTISTAISLSELRNELKQYGSNRILRYIDEEGDVVNIEKQEDLNAYLEYIEVQSKETRPKLLLDSPTSPLSKPNVLSLLHYGSNNPSTPTSAMNNSLQQPLSPSNIFPSYSDMMFATTIPTTTTTTTANRNRTLIKNWQLGKEIGFGANGTVYLGMDEDTSQLIAVKQVKLISAKKETLKKLEEEIQIMAKLDHENIVRYLGSEKKDGSLFIFIDYIPGGNMETIISEFNLREKVVRKYTQQILQGLSYLHRNNVVHCDIKGANILVHESGAVYLSDFGCSKEISNIAGHEISGTPNYMAPEVIESMRYTREGDIWSLGCTLLEMLTGQPPWAEQIVNFDNEFAVLNFIRTTDMTPPIPTGNISNEAIDFLSKCFEKDPSRRPSADALLDHPFITARELTYATGVPQSPLPTNTSVTANTSTIEETDAFEEEEEEDDDGFTFDHIDIGAELSDEEDELHARNGPLQPPQQVSEPKMLQQPPKPQKPHQPSRLQSRHQPEDSDSDSEDDVEAIENIDLDTVVAEVKHRELNQVFEGEAQAALDKPKRKPNRRPSMSSNSINRNSGSFRRMRAEIMNELAAKTKESMAPRADESTIQSFLRRNAKEQLTYYTGLAHLLKKNNSHVLLTKSKLDNVI